MKPLQQFLAINEEEDGKKKNKDPPTPSPKKKFLDLHNKIESILASIQKVLYLH